MSAAKKPSTKQPKPKYITKNYNFTSTHISKFKFLNNTSFTYTIQTKDKGKAISIQSKKSKSVTLKGLSEGEQFTLLIEEVKGSQIKKYRFALKFIYSKFSDAYANIKAADLASLKESDVIQNKELDYANTHLRYIGFHNSGAYIADFIVSYRSPGSSSWTDKKIDYFNAGRGTDKCSNQKDYPNGVYDLSKLNIPKGTEVMVKVNAQGGIGSGKKATSKVIFVYHPESNRVAKYKCSGISTNVKINNPSAVEMNTSSSESSTPPVENQPTEKDELSGINHIRYMGFHNSGAYIADFIVSYRSPGSSSWTDKKIDYFNAGRGTDECSNQKDYPNGVYDLSKLGIPNGSEVTAKVNAQGGVGSGKKATSKAVFVYHSESNRVAKFTCSGTSCATKINNPSAVEMKASSSESSTPPAENPPTEKDELSGINHIRYMGFHNSGAYAADFIVSYRSPGSSSWTDKKIDYFNAGRGTDECSNQKDYPNKVYDLSKLNLPKGYEVTAKVNAKGGIGSGKSARSKAIFVYHPSSNRVAKYKCSGTSCSTKINNPSSTEL